MDHTSTTTTPSRNSVPAVGEQAVMDALHAAAAGARAELARAAEGKAGLLLSWAGGAFAVVATLAVTGPARLVGVALAGVWAAVLLIAGAVLLLLLTVLPTLPKRGGTGFVAYAELPNPAALLAQVRKEIEIDKHGLVVAADAHRLSQLAVAKYRRVRWAVRLLVAAVVVLLVTLPAGLLL
ncbi:Pycsar system effector family protein [Streptosporangium sp. NPDC000563]|uniref:Pycsar system effector family protein n=1 Tax=Streptosporangium sp. NPDC000563 TaxID=3154366 RepID=UPI00332B86B1